MRVAHTLASLASVIAPAVGEERATELVSEAMAEAQIAGPDVTDDEARAIFARLSLRDGVVGVSARIGRARLGDTGRGHADAQGWAHGSQLVDLLAPAVGQERARELVDSTCRRLAIPVESLDDERVLRVLDALVTMGGIVGVAARFAKARAILKSS